MQRRLIVMRHAKSSWSSGAATDHARPLNQRGQRDAPRIARRLVELNWQPQLVLSSDSQRTRQTWELMRESWDGEVQVEFLRDFYEGGVAEVQRRLSQLDDEVHSVLVLGHNPGWEHVVHWLCDQEVRMTTANAALLQTEGESWNRSLTAAGTWHLCDIIRPKEL